MKEIGKKRTFVLHQTNGCFTSNERSFNFICPFVMFHYDLGSEVY